MTEETEGQAMGEKATAQTGLGWALTGFESWDAVLWYVGNRDGRVWYHAPLDRHPRGIGVERLPGGKLRCDPGTDADPFTADAGHLDRFFRLTDDPSDHGPRKLRPGMWIGHICDARSRDERVLAVGRDHRGRQVWLTEGGLFRRGNGREARAFAVRLGIDESGTATGGCCLFYECEGGRREAAAKARACFEAAAETWNTLGRWQRRR